MVNDAKKSKDIFGHQNKIWLSEISPFSRYLTLKITCKIELQRSDRGAFELKCAPFC
mgnify:CR=1 FL=1